MAQQCNMAGELEMPQMLATCLLSTTLDDYWAPCCLPVCVWHC
jgi:hypothetical protein